MKSSLKNAAGLLCAAILILSITGCPPNHVHTFAESWTSDAVNHWHAATCGDTDEVSGKAAHTFGDWVEVTAATEDAEGTREKICSVCSYKVTEPVPVLPHTHSLGTKYEAVNGTCTTKGTLEYYDCTKSSCKEKLDSSGNVLSSIEGTLNHAGTATTWTKTKTTHKETYDCCGAVKTAEGAHSFGAYETDSNGVTARTCTVCGYKDIVPAGFVVVAGKNIKGTETWTPSSKVFISGREIEIPTLIVCEHEVTRGEFKAIMGTDPSNVYDVGAYDKNGNKLTGDDVLNNPVSGVSWYDAITYCNKLSIKEKLTPCYAVEGVTDWESLAYSAIPASRNTTWDAVTCSFEANGYRLPTEAEWEWLARGGENYTYAGSDIVQDVAWYTMNTNNKGTREVKTKQKNGYDLYDMSGNAYEWCWDWDVPITSTSAATGASSGSTRELRGGSYASGSSDCEVADRYYSQPGFRIVGQGFRVVRFSSN